MAKQIIKKAIDKADLNGSVPPAFFKSLTIENYKCFKGLNTIDLSENDELPAQWTVIIGNNNTGKTTILKCLANLEPRTNINSETQKVYEPYYSARGSSLRQDNEFFKNHSIITTISCSFFNQKGKNNKLSKGGYSVAYNNNNEAYIKFKNPWGFKNYPRTRSVTEIGEDVFTGINASIYSYGAARKQDDSSIETAYDDHQSLFENADLPNSEDWLLNLFTAEKLGQTKATKDLQLAKQVLTSGILPDVSDINIRSQEKNNGFENFVEFKTDYGWIRLRDLGYGYQSMMAWVLDLVKRMVERYPKSTNPLAEPAIVLVDEIDLHLHPEWQRKIIAHLTKYFPNTQFIVTAHSPLIVQSAENVNLVMLKKHDDHVSIEQRPNACYQGWSVEDIMSELMMDNENHIYSDRYNRLWDDFALGIEDDDYPKAKKAYNELMRLLPPSSSQRKVLDIQMTALKPMLV